MPSAWRYEVRGLPPGPGRLLVAPGPVQHGADVVQAVRLVLDVPEGAGVEGVPQGGQGLPVVPRLRQGRAHVVQAVRRLLGAGGGTVGLQGLLVGPQGLLVPALGAQGTGEGKTARGPVLVRPGFLPRPRGGRR